MVLTDTLVLVYSGVKYTLVLWLLATPLVLVVGSTLGCGCWLHLGLWLLWLLAPLWVVS